MTASGIDQIVICLALLLCLAWPLGAYMAQVYEGGPFVLERLLRPLERAVCRLGGIRPEEEMSWRSYSGAVLLFSAIGLDCLYLLQRLQGVLPFNPQGLPAVSPDSAFNTARSTPCTTLSLPSAA